MTSTTGYSRLQIALHWIVGLLIVGQFVFKDSIVQAWETHLSGGTVIFTPLILAHVAGGAVLLLFVLWRLVLRARGTTQPSHGDDHPALVLLAKVAHASLYAVLVALSVSGALAWFGDIRAAAAAHDVLKTVLIALVALHVLAVPVHHFLLKTPVMGRMLRPGA